MAGFQGLFIPGPTNMPFAVRQAMDVPLEDQRSPDFPALTLPLFRDLVGNADIANGDYDIHWLEKYLAETA